MEANTASDLRTTIVQATQLAVMANDIDTIKKGMEELKQFLKSFSDTYATKEQTGDLERRIKNLEDNQTWLSRATIGAIIGIVASIIIALLRN